MKTYIARLLLAVSILLNGLLFAQTNPNHVYVNGYYRSNGTYVEGYYRTAPNSTNRDNFSTVGNTNPYTGKPGWIPADNNSTPSTYSNTTTYTYTPTYSTTPSYDVSSYFNKTEKKNNKTTSSYSGIAPKYGTTEFTTADLRLRSGASTGDDVILTMPAGSSVTVVNDVDSWSYVYYNGYYGYAHSSYLSSAPYKSKALKQFENSTIPTSTSGYNNSSSNSYYGNTNTNSNVDYGSGNNSGGSGKVLGWIFGIGLSVWLFVRRSS